MGKKEVKKLATKSKSIKKKEVKNSLKSRNRKLRIFVKIVLILIVTLGFYHTHDSFSNNISLLAVSNNVDNQSQYGSVLQLGLKIRPGTGKIYVNMNSIKETDTQISIIDSQQIACKVFNLDCSKYDFYYDFSGSALILKGPSASSAIAILTAKTVKHEKIDPKVVITGFLSSGGVIGVVGGLKDKIQAAQDLGFEKVLIPQFSDYNQSPNTTVKVVRVLDIIDAYNNFGPNKYQLKTYPIKTNEYQNIMKNLGAQMCQRSDVIKSQINFSNIGPNSTLGKYESSANKMINSSNQALQENNYYSQGSFCYSANINYRYILEKQQNQSLSQIMAKISALKNQVNKKYIQITSPEYKNNITTINDFYTYLILNDRIEEAKQLINSAEKLQSQNTTNNNSTNASINSTLDKINQITLYYSTALERFYTLSVWEKAINHSGNKINFNDAQINNACLKINREVNIENALLNSESMDFFQKDIDSLSQLTLPGANKYYCVYKGLQIKGNMNTLLNSIGMNKNNEENYTNQFLNLTQSRLSMNSNGSFPLIPEIYYEYGKDLTKSGDYMNALLYANYALVYSDLNLYLKNENIPDKLYTLSLNSLFDNTVFIFAILLMIGFI